MTAIRKVKSAPVRSASVALLAFALLLILFVGTAPASPDQVYTVTSTADPGPGTCDANGCTLHDAIVAANNDNDASQIRFAIGGGGPQTIQLGPGLPAVTAPVTIDGTTQPGTPANRPGVTILPDPDVLSGSLLDLAPGSGGSTVHGLAFGGNAGDGGTTAINVESDNDTVTGNWIGVAADSSSLGVGDFGIEVRGSHDTIGGGAAGAPNVITGSAVDAISIDPPGAGTSPVGNVIQGNLIGLKPNGKPASRSASGR